MGYAPATPKQISFIQSLKAERGLPTDEPLDTLSKFAAHKVIDVLLKTRPAKPAPERVEQEPVPVGVHVHNDEHYFVKKSKNERFYALLFVPSTGRWDYAPGAIRHLSESTVITAEQAAAFGHSYGRCVFCHKQLSDERSTEVGYGGTCAKKYNLPWG